MTGRQSNDPDPELYYPGRRVEINTHPRAMPYAGYPPGTQGEIVEVNRGGSDYCIKVLVDGFDRPDEFKTSNLKPLPALVSTPSGFGDGP